MVEPLMEDGVLPYFAFNDWAMGKGEYVRSKSLAGTALAVNKELGNEFVYACHNTHTHKKKKQIKMKWELITKIQLKRTSKKTYLQFFKLVRSIEREGDNRESSEQEDKNCPTIENKKLKIWITKTPLTLDLNNVNDYDSDKNHQIKIHELLRELKNGSHNFFPSKMGHIT